MIGLAGKTRISGPYTHSRVLQLVGTGVTFEKTATMRLFILALLAIATIQAHSQNEFADARFADAFKKLYADAPKGFAAYKGAKLRAMGSFYNIHKPLLLLPGADSAIIAMPVSVGSPSCMQYFKPSATLAAAQQREAGLQMAIKAAAGKALYEKKVVDTVGKFVFRRTQLYKKPGASVFDLDLETYVVLEKGRYLLVLMVQGKTPPPTPTGKGKLPAEPDLLGRINGFFAAMTSGFALEKGPQKEKSQYYTTYHTVSRLYGQTGTIKERTYENSLSFFWGSEQLDGPAEAKQIYEKLKAAFAATGRCRFNPETVEGSRTWFYASDANNTAAFAKFTLIVEYYNDAYNPSVSFLLTAKR
jgi:hypothetical protein